MFFRFRARRQPSDLQFNLKALGLPHARGRPRAFLLAGQVVRLEFEPPQAGSHLPSFSQEETEP